MTHPSQSALQLQKLISKRFNSSLKILELGCGKGFDANYLQAMGNETHAIDKFPILSQECFRFPMLVRDLTKEPIPFSKDSFDVVYSRLFFHYLTEEALSYCISQVHHVLKPSGIVYIVVKSKRDYYYQHFKSTGQRTDSIVEYLYDGKKSWRNFFDKPKILKSFHQFRPIKLFFHEEILYTDTHKSGLLTFIGEKQNLEAK